MAREKEENQVEVNEKPQEVAPEQEQSQVEAQEVDP